MFKDLLASFFQDEPTKKDTVLKNGDFFKTRLIIEEFNKTIEETYLVKNSFDMYETIKEFRLKTAFQDDQLVLFHLKDNNYIELVDEKIDDLKDVPTFVLIVESNS